MKTYLSFGAGVNSVAMMLLLLRMKWEFEAVYVDHGCDWPETREYVQMLKGKGYQITVITPEHKRAEQIWNNLYEYAWHWEIIPTRLMRWCTKEFKIDPLQRYFQKPCFNCLGFDSGETHRAIIQGRKGEEVRYPLIEYDIDRNGCKELIKKHGLYVPMKSGCYFCPFQRIKHFRLLRKEHPELFCKAKALENRHNERRIRQGKKKLYLKDKPLEKIVNEAQGVLFPEMKPPCYCTQ